MINSAHFTFNSDDESSSIFDSDDVYGVESSSTLSEWEKHGPLDIPVDELVELRSRATFTFSERKNNTK